MTADAVRIAIGNITLDHATFDDRGDVLYLHVGDRETAADSLGTPEGHTVRCNAAGRVAVFRRLRGPGPF